MKRKRRMENKRNHKTVCAPFLLVLMTAAVGEMCHIKMQKHAMHLSIFTELNGPTPFGGLLPDCEKYTQTCDLNICGRSS